jgi:DNA primase
VASLGTAFTPEQAKLLLRYTDRVIVSYDGDAAGQSATARSLDLLLQSGFQVQVADLPSGVDPDDFIRAEGAESYQRLLQAAPGFLEFLIVREARSRDLSRTEEKVAAVNALLPRIARLSSAVERASWAGRIADELRIEEDLILHELRTALRGRRDRIRHRAGGEEPLRPVEAQLVVGLIQAEDEAERQALELYAADLDGTRVAGIVTVIQALRRNNEAADFPSVFQALESEEERQLLANIALRENEAAGAPRLLECLRVLRRERLVRERGRLQREIETAASNPEGVDALLMRKQEIGRQIDAL